MKLIRFGKSGEEKPGIVDGGVYFDVSNFGEDYDESFFKNQGLQRLNDFVLKNKATLPLVPEGTRLGCPVSKPSKIVCIGLNYSDHAKESKAAIPSEPIIFLKATTALAGPFDNIIIPKNSTKTDWEVELAVVIGKRCSYISESEALNYIAGYVLHNDVSERSFQLEKCGTWDKGKGCDSFAPIGPFLVTPDEVPNINSARLWLKVNGNTMQDGNTSNLIYKIPFLISYVSQFMTLLPGDIISTGTPAGVGMGFSPSIYLKDGDTVELGIEGLGVSKQVAKDYSPI
jgi:2,4-didehydro-3-deoxy-L-rhamnonate hydrolase